MELFSYLGSFLRPRRIASSASEFLPNQTVILNQVVGPDPYLEKGRIEMQLNFEVQLHPVMQS